MKFYLAGSEGFTDLLKNIPEARSLLVSYWSLSKNEKRYKDIFKLYPKRDIFLDSGAFSAYTQQSKIDIDKYIDFIKRYKNRVSAYCGLDVIGDAEATFQNNLYMEKQGLTPIATFHVNEPFKYLKEYIKRYDYIALGGVIQLKGKRQQLQSWLDACWHYIMKKPNLKVHGFAIFAPSLMLRYPFYSVDASTWLIGSTYGNLIIPTPNSFKSIHYQDRAAIFKYAKLIQKYYPSIIDLLDEKSKNKLKYFNRCRFNILAIDAYNKYCTDIWEQRGVKW